MVTATRAQPPDRPDSPVGVLTARRAHAALAAILAVAAALGVGDLVAALVSPVSSPLVAVGQGAIRLTPEPVKELAIAWFGVYDKIALLVGMAAVIGGLTVAAGLASRRIRTPGSALVAAMGLIGGVAVVTGPTFSPVDLLAPLAALGAGLGAWTLLHRQALEAARAPSPTDAGAADPARRALLVGTAGVAVGAGAASTLGRLLATSAPAPPPLPPAATPVVTVPRTGTDFAAVGTPSWLTPNPDFYRIDTALSVPRLTTSEWSLRIHGMVDRELRIGYDQLAARRLVEAPVTLTCVSNEVGGGLVSNAVWRGVPIRDLLAEAGVRPGAEQVLQTSADGWTCNTPLGPLTDDRPAMLAIGMNGEALPVEHGFPVRMVVPGLYGYVSACKWITDIEVTTFDAVTSYWEQRGWGKFGPIKTQSRIDAPRAGAQVPAGPTTVAGVAWAQHRGVDRVEVSLDGGPWATAELAEEPTIDSWRMWRLSTTLPPGEHRLGVRATDRTGAPQTGAVAPVLPDGATGWHTVEVTAV